NFETVVVAMSAAFAMALGIGCGLVFGVVPALQLARVDPQIAMRAGSYAAGRSRTRNALMGTQVALALIVLTAGALFFRSFRETRETDTGFRRDGILLGAYDLTARNPNAAQSLAFAATGVQRTGALPHGAGAALAPA